MAGFGAVSFKILVDSADRSREADVTVIKVPGGDTYVDIGGARETHIPLEIYFASGADYASLEALVGTQATLVTDIDTISNAFLKSLRRTWRNGTAAAQTKASADFIIPSA